MIAIKNSYFKDPDGNRYFRRNASSVVIGGYGEGKTPLTEANYLSVDGHIAYDHLKGKIQKTGPVNIDWAHESKADIEAYVKYFFVAGGKANFTHEKAKEANLKLVRFFINAEPLKNILNKDADKVRGAMKKEGNDARVCSSIYVAMSGELAERFNTSMGLEVSGTLPGDLSITATGGAGWSGSEKVTFSPGTVFAYALHKVKKWNGDHIEDLEDDWQGFN
ncbi:MAG: hypothetical protein AB7F94_10300 [Nitrospira sp.]